MVQWLRARFNECFEKVEFAKARYAAEELPFIEKSILDRAREFVSSDFWTFETALIPSRSLPQTTRRPEIMLRPRSGMRLLSGSFRLFSTRSCGMARSKTRIVSRSNPVRPHRF